jgi:hypothetical protein
MNLKKRGLGRGLEALLAEVPDKEVDAIKPVDQHPEHSNSSSQEPIIELKTRSIDDGLHKHQPEVTIALIKNIQRENLLLQQEAMEFKKILEEFEQLLRGHD